MGLTGSKGEQVSLTLSLAKLIILYSKHSIFVMLYSLVISPFCFFDCRELKERKEPQETKEIQWDATHYTLYNSHHFPTYSSLWKGCSSLPLWLVHHPNPDPPCSRPYQTKLAPKELPLESFECYVAALSVRVQNRKLLLGSSQTGYTWYITLSAFIILQNWGKVEDIMKDNTLLCLQHLASGRGF